MGRALARQVRHFPASYDHGPARPRKTPSTLRRPQMDLSAPGTPQMTFGARLICPTADFQKSCQAPDRKIFLFIRSANHVYVSPRSAPCSEGRIAIVTTR